MSKTYISQALRQQAYQLSGHRCAYCLTPEWIVGTAFTIDHIIPESLGGKTIAENYWVICHLKH